MASRGSRNARASAAVTAKLNQQKGLSRIDLRKQDAARVERPLPRVQQPRNAPTMEFARKVLDYEKGQGYRVEYKAILPDNKGKASGIFRPEPNCDYYLTNKGKIIRFNAGTRLKVGGVRKIWPLK